MLEIAFIRDKQRGILGFTANGHAEYADYGEDIVCSAVSALCQTAYLGIEEVVRAKNKTHIGESGEMRLLLLGGDEEIWKAAQVVLQTLELGIKAIAAAYPAHLHISNSWR